MCRAVMGREDECFDFCQSRFMTSQKRCCPVLNGLRRMRPVVGVLAISYKKRTCSFSGQVPELAAREFYGSKTECVDSLP